MATKLSVTVARKVPGEEPYSSLQASCTIESEITGDPVVEARGLYGKAEQAVNTQLHLGEPTKQVEINTTVRDTANRPTRGRIPPASDSQIRLLGRLLNGDRDRRTRLLAHYGVGDLAELNIKDASSAIDVLKGGRS